MASCDTKPSSKVSKIWPTAHSDIDVNIPRTSKFFSATGKGWPSSTKAASVNSAHARLSEYSS